MPAGKSSLSLCGSQVELEVVGGEEEEAAGASQSPGAAQESR